ncbi:MAG: RNA polymerase sporulation sigma factor SigK [Oscillospiraceae bacterium]
MILFLALLSAISSNMLYLMLHIQGAGSFPKPLSPTEEAELLEKIKTGDAAARDKLINHNLRLVAHIIKKYYSSFSEQDDLISIGTIGLIKGINSFDSSKGTRLATYAARCVENEILMHFRNQKKTSQDVSMSEPIDIDSEGNPLTLSDVIFTDDTIADDIDLKIKIENLRKHIDSMKDDREKNIVIKRYGINGCVPLTQREIAKEMNISRSYVSRIEKKALCDLRKKFEDDS